MQMDKGNCGRQCRTKRRLQWEIGWGSEGSYKDKGLYSFELPAGDEGKRLTMGLSELYYLQESSQWELRDEEVHAIVQNTCNNAVTQLFQCHRKDINLPKKGPEWDETQTPAYQIQNIHNSSCLLCTCAVVNQIALALSFRWRQQVMSVMSTLQLLKAQKDDWLA